MKYVYFSTFWLFSIMSCNPTAKIIKEEGETIAIKTTNENPHILSAIIVFQSIKDKIAIKEHNFVLAESKLKEGSLIRQEQPHHLKCDFTDSDGKILHTQWIENPLTQRVEGVDKNGDLITIQNSKEEGTGLVRVNFTNAMTHLNIYNKEVDQNMLIQSIELINAKN